MIGWQVKAIVIGLVLAALGGLLWHDHHQTQKANRLAREVNQVRADYAALQAAQAHERKIATDASHDYETRLQALSAARADTPVRSVRLCNSPTGWVPAPAAAASGVGPTGPAGLPSALGQNPGYGSGLQTGEVDRWSDSGPNIGPELYALADEADMVAAQCNALQGWIKAR